jgi:hypothetical protein
MVIFLPLRGPLIYFRIRILILLIIFTATTGPERAIVIALIRVFLAWCWEVFVTIGNITIVENTLEDADGTNNRESVIEGKSPN